MTVLAVLKPLLASKTCRVKFKWRLPSHLTWAYLSHGTSCLSLLLTLYCHHVPDLANSLPPSTVPCRPTRCPFRQGTPSSLVKSSHLTPPPLGWSSSPLRLLSLHLSLILLLLLSVVVLFVLFSELWQSLALAKQVPPFNHHSPTLVPRILHLFNTVSGMVTCPRLRSLQQLSCHLYPCDSSIATRQPFDE